MRSRSLIRQLLVQFRAQLPRLQDPEGPHFEQRVVTRSGLPNIIRVGDDHSHLSDLYHLLLTMPWLGFFGLVFFIYMGANGGFALLYLVGGNTIARAEPGSFWDAFFFSVQTMASLGYGAMHPDSFYTNSIVTLESLVGLLGLATITGIVFARVSRPTARVIFSDLATVSHYNGVPTLMFRMRNQRRNQILEGQIMLTLLMREVSEEGQVMYRFHSLDLVRSQTPIFALTWTIMHPIDRNSPLYGMNQAKLSKLEGEIVATLTGLDETFSQTIHARHSYLSSEILWDHRFVDVFSTRPDGRRVVNYRYFHDVIAEGAQHPSERAA